jgi:PhzF family phenazine biosynthesis protein
MMRYYIVDSFTDQPFSGNPAGIVLLGEEAFPSERLMTQVAAELRYSETAFVRRLSPTEYHLRYFTPAAEVELCGHATVATFVLLYKLGMAQGQCQYHTMAGDLEVEAGERVMMQMAMPHIIETLTDTAPVYHAIGLDNYQPTLPAQVAYSGLADIMIQVPDTATLNSLQPDMDAISAITKAYNTVSFHVFALVNDGHTAYVRNFAPLYDIPEESATGTANAALTHYLAVNGVIPATGDFSFMQGEAMGHPSIVSTRIATDGTLYVGGTAIVVAEGNLKTY